jgi:peptidoglycan/LPS O-acetylase OafA/YrhL
MLNDNPIYFKGLNGIRAIAAISVVVCHVSMEINLLIPRFQYNNIHIGLGMAEYGVTMFFTLSGFLISFLLLSEKRNSAIDIKKFYIRRILRIWPLYFGYLIIALIISFVLKFNTHPWSYFYYVLLMGNVSYALGYQSLFPLLFHYWSIGVEEQFYLFWPFLLQKAKNSIKGILIFLIAFILCKIVLRCLLHKYGLIFRIPYSLIYITRFDCMAIGGIGAYYYYKKQRLFLKYTTSTITQIIAWACLVVVAVNKFNITDFINHEVVGCVTLCIIIGQITVKKRIVNLDSEVLKLLGKISYGIYVIHPIVLYICVYVIVRYFANSMVMIVLTYPTVILLTVLVAYLSYEYYEKIFLKTKSKFTVIASSMGK